MDRMYVRLAWESTKPHQRNTYFNYRVVQDHLVAPDLQVPQGGRVSLEILGPLDPISLDLPDVKGNQAHLVLLDVKETQEWMDHL